MTQNGRPSFLIPGTLGITDARILNNLEVFAVGDAMGMPTEFMTRSAIRQNWGMVDRLLQPEESANHSDLPRGSITDDTEQNLYLLKAYREAGQVTVEATAEYLLRWIHETDAVAKKYIGPSSLKALKAVEAGDDPTTTGLSGNTSGAVMRIPSILWLDPDADDETLTTRIVNCLMPTHYTAEALEAAGAVAFAWHAAHHGGQVDEVIEAAQAGAARCRAHAPWQSCAPSVAKRLALFRRMADQELADDDAKLTFIYAIFGTGLPAIDVATAALAIYTIADGSPWWAIRLGASIGGDTDTIAALAGCLTAAGSSKHDIPEEVVETVRQVNAEFVDELAG